MAQYNTLNVKLSNLQLNKIKSGTKNGNEITVEILSNVIGDSNDGNNFSHNLFLIRMFWSFIKLLQIILQLI